MEWKIKIHPSTSKFHSSCPDIPTREEVHRLDQYGLAAKLPLPELFMLVIYSAGLRNAVEGPGLWKWSRHRRFSQRRGAIFAMAGGGKRSLRPMRR